MLFYFGDFWNQFFSEFMEINGAVFVFIHFINNLMDIFVTHKVSHETKLNV